MNRELSVLPNQPQYSLTSYDVTYARKMLNYGDLLKIKIEFDHPSSMLEFGLRKVGSMYMADFMHD